MSFRLSSSLSATLICVSITVFGQQVDSAEFYYSAGNQYDEKSRYDTAVLLYEKALRLYEQGGIGEAKTRQALGDVFKFAFFDFDKAEENYKRALAIYENVSPSDLKTASRLYYGLAATNKSQRDYETAIGWCLKSKSAGEKLNDMPLVEVSYLIMGNIYRDMRRFDSSRFYYEKSIAMNKANNKGKPNETLAAMYEGLGQASYRQGNLDEAVRQLKDAVAYYEKYGVRDPLLYLHAVRLLAEVEIKHGDLDAAKFHLQTASNLRKDHELEKSGAAADIYQTWAMYFLKKNDREQTILNFSKALEATMINDSVQLKNYAYETLLGLADFYLSENEIPNAITNYSNAEKLMIANRRELDTEEARWNYIDANYRLYENIMSALYQSGSPDDSTLLHFMESSKSKSLADALREAELKKVVDRGDTLLARLRDLRQRSLSLQHEINEKNENEARYQLITTTREIENVESAINRKYPSYLKTKYESASVSLAVLKEKIKLLDAAFIEYFWGYDNIYALVISSDSTGFYRLGNSSEFGVHVSDFVGRFSEHGNQYSPEAVTAFAKSSNKVYHELMQPFAKLLAGKKRLIIIPDGPLIQVPFETLVMTEGGSSYNKLSYLLNDFVVSYGFSGSYLTAARRTPKSNPSLLAFGFTGGSAERSFDASRVEIAGSETELLALAEKFPRGTFLFGDSVTEKNFKDKASSFDLLHLAVHGSGDASEDYSATLYFRDKQDPEDGHLYWYELYNMNLAASLAVLSSCESGIGKTYRGEGMLSMANAFTFAGCENIVMGLWKVDDQVSVRLMDTFYSELLEGMAIDEALAMAKRTYLASADQVSANPKLWGSLVAYGESPVLRADQIPTWWMVIALTALVAAITLLVIKTRKK